MEEEPSESDSASLPNDILIKDSIRTIPKSKRKLRCAGICTKQKCVKSIERRLPPVRQPNPKDEEAWAVKALPSNWAPVSKPSKVIENLLQKRKAQHEAVIDKIKAQFATINLDVEAQIRLNSEMLKQDLADVEKETLNHIETVDVDTKDMLALCKENFETVAQKVSELHQKQLNKIENLYVFLEELEKSRADKFKEVLKTAYRDLHQISYKLPYELEQYFEQEIFRINQILLSNFRCYADLQLQLNLQAENRNRLNMQNLDAVKAKWRDVKKRDVLKKLNEKSFAQPDYEAIILQTEQGKNASRLFVAKEQTMVQMLTQLSPLPITTKDVNTWTRHTEETVNGLDMCAIKLINLYKMAVLKVFNGYFDELQNLTEHMVEMGLVDTADVSVMSLDICKPTIESITRQYSADLDNLERLWDTVIRNLQKKLQATYFFLKRTAHLWDSHFQRLAEAKRLVLKDLNKVIEKNNKATQDQEIKLNIALDQMRQAPTEAKLEETMEDVNDLLDTLNKAYNSHYSTEVKVVEKYLTLVETEAEVLLAELTLFLHAHPKDLEVDPTQLKRRESQCSIPREEEVWVLPQQMKQCEYQVAAVENWMFGLWEAIEKYVSTCKDETCQQASAWAAENIKKLGKRLEIKIALRTPDYSRIKIGVFNIRLAELKTHSERLIRHKAGVEKEIEDVKKTYAGYNAKYTEVIEEYQKKIETIQSKMQNAKNSTRIKACISDLNYNTNLCNQKINNLFEEQDTICSLAVYKSRASAVKFSKQMKLFLEEGNFNCEEAKKMSKDLKTFEKTIKKKFNAVKKDIQTRERKITQQVQFQEAESLYRLNSSLEEFKFNENENDKIKLLQAQIRSDVYDVKVLHKKLQTFFEEIENERQINLGDMAHLDYFEDKLNQIVKLMLEISNYLYQPEPAINVSRRDPEQVSSEKRQQAVAKKRGSNLVNYADLLFNTVPTENNSFMSKICCNLYKSLEVIQLEAKEFYEKHGEILNKGKVQPSYDEFMKEVFEKYNFYHLQCELLWLDLVNELFKILLRLKKFTCTYRSDFIQQHHSNHIERFLTKHQELVMHVTRIQDFNKHLLQQILDKLKPLHGYPKNKPLLEELQNEMNEATEKIRSMDNDLLQPYKDTREEYATLYEWELYEADNKLRTFCYEFFDELLNYPLIEQCEQKLVHIDFLFSEQHTEDVSDTDQEKLDKIKAIEIPSEYRINLEHIQALQQGDVVHTTESNTDSDIEPYEYLQKFNEEYTHILATVDQIEASWNENVDNFEKIFNTSIQKILKLYRVKYDLLPQ